MSDRDPIGVDDPMLDDLTLEALAEAYAVAPPKGLRGRVLGQARPTTPAPERGNGTVTRWRMVGALAATVALVLGGLLAREREQSARREGELASLRSANAMLTAQLDQQGKVLAGLRESLDTQVHVIQVMSGPRTLVAQLAPKGDRGGSGRVLVDHNSGEVALVASDLAALEPGKAYELWAIRGSSAPEPAGVFVVQAGQATAVRLPRVSEPGSVSAFAVSIEPAAGSASPTGPIVLVGAVAS